MSLQAYLSRLSRKMGVEADDLVRAWADAAGTTVDEIRRLVEEGREPRFDFYPPVGFVPAPDQDLGHARINQHGHRGDRVTRERPPNVLRIALLGGSAAWGRGATSERATVASVLQRRLEENGVEYDVEVLNLAVPGFNSLQEYLYFLREGARWNPDLVVVFSGANDIQYAWRTGQANVHPTFLKFGQEKSAPGGLLRRTVARLSRLFRGDRARARGLELPRYTYTVW